MYWTLELASKLEDAPWPATKDELLDYANRIGAPSEVIENLSELEDEDEEVYESILDIWPDYPTQDEDFFFNELLPKVEKQYRVIGDKQHRAVAGLSMGGGGSTSYAERHSDLFGACYAMSALMELPQYTPEQEQNTDLESMEGQLYVSVRNLGCTKFLREASDEVKKQLRTVQWFVDCGDDDFLLDRNLEFYQAMREARIPCQLRVRDGGHTWEYWHSALYTCLPFVTRVFK